MRPLTSRPRSSISWAGSSAGAWTKNPMSRSNFLRVPASARRWSAALLRPSTGSARCWFEARSRGKPANDAKCGSSPPWVSSSATRRSSPSRKHSCAVTCNPPGGELRCSIARLRCSCGGGMRRRWRPLWKQRRSPMQRAGLMTHGSADARPRRFRRSSLSLNPR